MLLSPEYMHEQMEEVVRGLLVTTMPIEIGISSDDLFRRHCEALLNQYSKHLRTNSMAASYALENREQRVAVDVFAIFDRNVDEAIPPGSDVICCVHVS